MKRNHFGLSLLAYAIVIISVLLTLAPFSLSIMTALKTGPDFLRNSPLALPNPATLANFQELLSADGVFVAPVAVTLQMVAVILVGQMVFSVLAAFAFAQLEFPGRDALFWVYLATLMVPQVVVIVPLYLMMSGLELRNTFLGLVLPFVFGSPYAIFLLRENFRSMPTELVDAMRLDGAGLLRILYHLIVPLNRPIIATLTLITVVTHWNSFMWPLVMASGKTWQTITVATASLQTQYNSNWPLVMAATTLAMLPLTVLFIIFNKQITRSMNAGSLR